MPEASRLSPRRLKTAGLAALLIAGAVVVIGVVGRVYADQEVKTWTHEQAIPNVSLAKLQSGGVRKLALPGDIQAFANAEIHARVDGYLKRWHVDIGAPVKAGQLLAEIDAPDVDQQVIQARADLAEAQANQTLAATTAKRWEALLARDVVSKQAAEEKAGDLAAKVAATNAARANLNRLMAMASFKRITAPFDGVVTSRNTDVGALISAGGQTPLFTVADPRRLRVYVRVPQSYSALVKRGMEATITSPDYPGESFKAVVANDAQAVATESGAVLVELQLDNKDGKLKPGGYAQAAFDLPATAAALQVPATAVMFRHDGPAVAMLGADGHAHIRKVTLGRDLGSSLEVTSGVTAQDRVIDNPPETLADGDPVRLAKTSPGKAG
jgi:RND family efflux transporter MFP subunit